MSYCWVIIAAAALFAAGCTPAPSGARQPSAGGREPPPATEAEVQASYSAAAKGSGATFLDTLNRGKELALTDEDLPALAAAAAPEANRAQSGPRFRIQILASSQADMVRRAKSDAETATGLPVFMASEQSLYKLYVGDYKTKAEADAALPEIKSKGYADAWVVNVK